MSSQQDRGQPAGRRRRQARHVFSNYFLCVPLVTPVSEPQLAASIQNFKHDVCTPPPPLPANASASSSNPSAETKSPVPDKAVRPVGSLHLTLGVMSLNPVQLEIAAVLLLGREIRHLLHEATQALPEGTPSGSAAPAPTTQPLTISLTSLDAMRDPHSTSVLFMTPTDPTNRLQPLCEGIRKCFLDAKLLTDDNRPLKMHATIVNTVYLKGRGKSRRPLLSIDAVPIIERYRDYVWAEGFAVDRIAICEMGARRVHDGEGRLVREEYKEVASVALPVV